MLIRLGLVDKYSILPSFPTTSTNGVSVRALNDLRESGQAFSKRTHCATSVSSARRVRLMHFLPGKRWMLALTVGLLASTMPVKAGEGGVSFWLPGLYGSLAAVPAQPGWSFATIYYHTSVNAGGDVAFARQVSRGNITANFTGNLNASLLADADFLAVFPTYVFSTPVLGGQLALGMGGIFGRSVGDVDVTLRGAIGPFGFTRSAGLIESTTGFGDLLPQASLKWNQGVHNFMTYMLGDIPVGDYERTRLANIGIGHGAVD